jgi:hypothetical protein
MTLKIVLLILLVFLVLPAATICADHVLGANLGLSLKDIKDPGASILYGIQTQAGQNDYVRFFYEQINYGNELYSNVGAMEIHYFGLSDKIKIGTRAAVDYEPDDANIGLTGGAELLSNNLFDQIGLDFVAVGFLNDVSGLLYGDMVHRPETGVYFRVGVALILPPLRQ